jgi:hypothetical protein
MKVPVPNKALVVALTLSATLLTACSTMNVRSDSAAAASLGACHTYSWMAPPPGSQPNPFGNPLNDQRLRDAVSQRLQSRGMAPAATGGAADCQVSYSAGSRTTIENNYDRPRFSFGFGTGWGRWGRGGGGSVFWDTSYPYAYNEHRVSLDVFQGDDAARKPLWHASVDLDLANLSGAEAEKRIDAAVAAMFAKFPVAAR